METPAHVFNERHRRTFLYAALAIRFYMSLTSLGISVAIPSIVRHFDAVSFYALVIAVYYAVNMTSSSIGGRLSDFIGRSKAITLLLISLSLSTVLCAVSPSMPVFIAGYLLFGMSYGLLMSMPIALICDTTTMTSRHKYMGYFMALNNLGLLLGPLIGGFITDQIGFRFAPVYTIPLAIAIMIVINVTPGKPASNLPSPKLDLAGIIFLTLGISPLVIALTLAGNKLPWNSPITLGMIAGGILFLVLFVKQEFRASHPILAVKLFKVRSFIVGNLMIMIIIPYMILCNNYSILMVQNGLHESATISGTINFPKTFMIFLLSWLSNRWMTKFRYRLKAVILFAGAIILATEIFQALTIHSPSALFILLFCMGIFGIGESLYAMTVNPYLQSELTPENLATGISTASFFQMIGVTLSSTGFGIILNAYHGDIYAAFPAMCVLPAVCAVIYLVIGGLFIKMPKES